MQTIRELSRDIVAKIAAGEVVERPAYAVKELIDNAIDAKATEIFIEIQDAGFKKIGISDNGIGMSKEDLRECFRPHTTSKLSSAEELYAIRSLGFRGEALWSITSISNTIIKSKRQHQDSGYQIELLEGKIASLTSVGIPTGTIIEIYDLFHNIPARLKFMRSTKTEFRHILDIVNSFALAYPHIGFHLKHKDKTVLNFTVEQDTAQRAGILFGPELYENLIPVKYEHEYVTIHGFVTKPQASVNSWLKQFTFVNNRRVFDRIISSTVKDAYGTLLEPKNNPAFLLFIQIPPERVDVNIHPRKEQVAFAETSIVSKAVYEATVSALSQKNIAYHDMRWKRGEYINNTPVHFTMREGNTGSYAAKLLKETVDPWTVNNTDILRSSDIIQVHNTFIITQTKQGLIMIDQHAAHERILYEQFLDHFKKEIDKRELHVLEKPVELSLGVQGAQILRDNIDSLHHIGFDITLKDADSFTITTIPALYRDQNLQQLLVEILDDVTGEKPDPGVDMQTNKMLSFLACRTAIKAGDKLTKEQAKNVVEKLQASKIKYTCPHGRPVQVELSLRELYRLFHRV